MAEGILKENKHRAAFVVHNDRGLHTRPSTELVKCASTFSSDIWLKYKRQLVNAKSLLGILMLAVPKGGHIAVEAEGADAEEAVHTIQNLADKNFNIIY